MLISLFFIAALSDPTETSTPEPTPLPTGKFIGLLFGCAACAAVVMLIICAIALRIMKPSSDQDLVNKPLLPE